MAGESPDRSKQRESSEQKTSGSASPVPEARSEASAESPRDPRVPVSRDTEKSSARGGVDTATRVFSVRTPDEPTDAPSDDASDSKEPADATPDAEQGDGDGDAEASGSGQGDDTSGSDGRLRDAVAAWVASADADEDEKPDAAEGRDEDAESAESAEKGSGDDQEPEKAAEGAGESPGGSADAPAAEAASEGSEGSEASQDEDDEPEADRSATDADAPEADADTDSEPDTAASEAADSEPAEDDGAASDADSTADSDAEAEPKTESTADADGEAAKPKAPRAADDSKAEPKTDSTPDADAKAAKAESKADSAADTDAKVTKPKDPRATDDSDDADDSDEDPSPGAEGEGTGEAPESGKGDDEDEDDGSAGARVDQPTAVFKAPRPAVDQPTTMLKIGGAAKGKDAPEKEAERTSKFVALKPLDEPATRKPAAPAAPAPAPAEATAPVPAVSPERTTQQPLPPRPPLDMLAELTNTPPPPDTPLRTAVRRVKIWTPLALLLVIVFAVVQSVRPLPAPTLELSAKDSYTFEGGKVDIPWPADGQAALDVQGIGTFGSSGEQKPVPIASVAKVMTAYVILRDHPLKSGEDGPKIGIDQAAEDQSDAGQESTVDVTKGDKITQREALESILIASANNVARLLARWDAGSEKAFVQKMNDAAEDLGMKNSTYTDPSGLNNTTVSTAVDQVKLARAAMEQPAFREVAAMMSYVDYKGTKHDNWNRLVGYNDVTGIKTGTTTSALGNLVFSAKKDVDGETHRVIGAVVRQPAGGPDNTILGAALHEGDQLIRAAQGALESATILKKGDIVGYADDGLGGRTPVAVTEDVTAVGWAGLSVKLTFAADELPHTAKAGQKVGTLTVGDGSSSAVKVPVALQEDLVEPGFADKLTRIG
ncbi:MULTISPECIES: D-alanyl-D-alanine carboxypeptidase [Streptomyces]|uniref:D-alanyl-D-alanine carboxypeptidase n=1 Tax=Streptomyces TaxID=1883 RepID=UPI00203552C4|nr:MULTISPECIES: D-alanyl-D-alanine carboxypeptidase [Streptomyces]UUA08008.1 D-alanyl-D-alanine carboxypeptidase [Streptomyces koelreuteriae]UUA15637.1 D-alanyl-D-alanine carboxypeptidase [Streptomyces sp. CRCS-T-1]